MVDGSNYDGETACAESRRGDDVTYGVVFCSVNVFFPLFCFVFFFVEDFPNEAMNEKNNKNKQKTKNQKEGDKKKRKGRKIGSMVKSKRNRFSSKSTLVSTPRTQGRQDGVPGTTRVRTCRRSPCCGGRAMELFKSPGKKPRHATLLKANELKKQLEYTSAQGGFGFLRRARTQPSLVPV